MRMSCDPTRSNAVLENTLTASELPAKFARIPARISRIPTASTSDVGWLPLDYLPMHVRVPPGAVRAATA